MTNYNDIYFMNEEELCNYYYSIIYDTTIDQGFYNHFTDTYGLDEEFETEFSHQDLRDIAEEYYCTIKQ
jgi:hypothetical protein